MQAHNNNIEEFLGSPKTVLVVPVYQRNYDWQNENCRQLFHDIIGIIKSNQEHFLGTICFKMYSSHERSIIDGQQRLTSITIMLKATTKVEALIQISSGISSIWIVGMILYTTSFWRTQKRILMKSSLPHRNAPVYIRIISCSMI